MKRTVSETLGWIAYPEDDRETAVDEATLVSAAELMSRAPHTDA